MNKIKSYFTMRYLKKCSGNKDLVKKIGEVQTFHF